MEIVDYPVGRITLYENNPRDNDEAVSAVMASIREFGWQQPIVVDEDGVIVVGHTRYKAALAMGLETVPVKVAHGLTEELMWDSMRPFYDDFPSAFNVLGHDLFGDWMWERGFDRRLRVVFRERCYDKEYGAVKVTPQVLEKAEQMRSEEESRCRSPTRYATTPPRRGG